jgi:hypothetical protein
MKAELTITFEEDELEMVKPVATALVNGDVSREQGLGEEEQYVLRALRQHQDGAARRVIHRDAAATDGSPFTNPDADGKERSEVGSILSRLVNKDLAQREKSTWYPVEQS